MVTGKFLAEIKFQPCLLHLFKSKIPKNRMNTFIPHQILGKIFGKLISISLEPIKNNNSEFKTKDKEKRF